MVELSNEWRDAPAAEAYQVKPQRMRFERMMGMLARLQGS
jgi:hypothetical protein